MGAPTSKNNSTSQEAIAQLGGTYAQPYPYQTIQQAAYDPFAVGAGPSQQQLASPDALQADPWTPAPSWVPPTPQQQEAISQLSGGVPLPPAPAPATAAPAGAAPVYQSPSGVSYNAIGNQVSAPALGTGSYRTMLANKAARAARLGLTAAANSRAIPPPPRQPYPPSRRSSVEGDSGGIGGGSPAVPAGPPAESVATDPFRQLAYARMMGGNFYGGVIPEAMRSAAPPGDVWGLLNSMGIQNPQNMTPQQAMQQASAFGVSPFGSTVRRG